MSISGSIAEVPAFDILEAAKGLFDELARATSDPHAGITREAFGPGEDFALKLFKSFSEQHGLETAIDPVGNLVVTLPGQEPELPYVACGSHMDSVPRGGNYDGAAGVVAGLLCLAWMKAEGLRPQRSIKVLGLRCEESAWFGKAYVGSSGLLGKLSRDDLATTHRDKPGLTLAGALDSIGANMERIEAGEAILNPQEMQRYFELHIEQGPVLTSRDLPTAIVTGIRGAVRHKHVVCRGQAGHSGTVPRWLRRDALFAVAELISSLDEHWRVLLERGLDLVVTFGIINTDPAEHSMTRIPGEVGFSFEVRSQSIEALEAFYHLMRTECRNLESQRKVSFEFDRRLDSAPARMDESIIKSLQQVSRELKLPDETVPSGAGHDAAMFANAGVPSGMIFVRNDHGSHNPDEAMDLDDFIHGVELLHQALMMP
jgi:N-carbamoyl-L-amino-acid hydrolase